MPQIVFQLRTSAPVFIRGSDSHQRAEPEFRAPSVRGQLRYWLRALLGAAMPLDKVWDAESDIFGSTGSGSKVSVRVSRLMVGENAIETVPMLPHSHDDRRQSPAKAIRPGTKVRLTLATRPGVAFPPMFHYALSTWLLLGGVGKRSRRMYGGFEILESGVSDDDILFENWWGPLRKPDWLVQIIPDVLGRAYVEQSPVAMQLPTFPTLHPDYSRIIVGKRSFESVEEANVRLFHDLLREGKYRQNEEYFGYARDGRRASPLHAQVRFVRGQWYPVLTWMRSKPELPRGRQADVAVINDFMAEAERVFEGETVWGGAFK